MLSKKIWYKNEEVKKVPLEVYHGTTKDNAEQILNEGFKIIPKEVTNDLGHGIYTFCPDELNRWNPKDNARRYAKKYKNGKIAVLKVTIDTSSKVHYVDLDDDHFKQNWEKIRKELEQRANELWKGYHKGNAKRRHNIDGILLELAIQNGMLDEPRSRFCGKVYLYKFHFQFNF